MWEINTFAIIIGVINLIAFSFLPSRLNRQHNEGDEESEDFIDVPYTEFIKTFNSAVIILVVFIAGYVGTFFESFLTFYFTDVLHD